MTVVASTSTSTKMIKKAIGEIVRQFRPRLCLLGPPGSGKGSYGKILARHWGIPIISVSDVLKQQQEQNDNDNDKTAMSSGKLVDDRVVSQALVDYFHHLNSSEQKDEDSLSLRQTQNKNNNSAAGRGASSYLLDGFPRTIQQVHLMEQEWPADLQPHGVVHFNLPLEVCERKLLGRRICGICGNHFNVHGVLWGGFDLPPKLPRPGECHRTRISASYSLPHHHQLSRGDDCDANSGHWIQRDDDQQHDIIHRRLEVHRQHTQPILDYYHNDNHHRNNHHPALFEFVPFNGFKDMPKFQSELEEWLIENVPESVVEHDENNNNN